MIRRAGERSRLCNQGMTLMKPAVQQMLNRRRFFQSVGAVAAGATTAAFVETAEARAEAASALVQSNVKRSSEPSALKITDLRYAVVVNAPMTCPIIRIDTNQGISGYGEVRDGSSETYALFLKSRILGENPCNVDQIFRKIKQFGAPARQAGGVCGIEMALHGSCGQGLGRARAGRCSAASSAIASGSMRTRRTATIRSSRASG